MPGSAADPATSAPRWRWDARELAGAVADLGVLVPIAVALVLVNGLSATAVLLPAGLLYLTAGLVYRVPVPVQPLKAFGAIAVAQGLGADVIAAGALVMGVLFLGLGATGGIDAVARWVPRPVVRGVQLSVGLLFLQLAWGLAADPPASFTGPQLGSLLGPAAAVAVAGLLALGAVLLRRWASALVLVVAGVAVMLATHSGGVDWGPSALHRPELTGSALLTATERIVEQTLRVAPNASDKQRDTVAAGLTMRLGLRGVEGTAGWTGPAGDALYAVLIYVLVAFCTPRARVGTVAAAAFGICAGIELFQLTGVPAALGQAFPPARLVLGTGFLWSDLVLYGVGVAAVALVDAALRRRRRP